MKEELKLKLFQTVEDQLPLADFESWLYRQEDLSLQMDENLILELYSFNYKQQGAKYAFKSLMLPYLESEEFMRWKVKTNLQDLIDGKESAYRILDEFYWQLSDQLPFLQKLSYHVFNLEESEYGPDSRAQVMADIKLEASALLKEILENEQAKPAFAIYSFRRKPISWTDAKMADAENSKKWWQL